MLSNKSYYKGQDFNDDYKYRMHNYFNPFEYNFESNIKDRENSDVTYQKSKSHNERNIIKK